MCRLFTQISTVPANAYEHLAESDFSLLRQSNFDKTNLQKDGWGIGYFAGNGQTVVHKSPAPAFKEPEQFKQSARAASRVVMGHLRAASNPRGLAKKRLISEANSQPYTDGRWIFIHNGTLEIPDEVAKHLGPLRRRLKSLNDSEVYFWQFIKFWRKTGSPEKAFAACVAEDWQLWKKCRSRYPQKKTPYTSLNAIAGDGKNIYALCHAIRPSRLHGICNRKQPWGVMSWAQRGRRLIVGSENLDRGRWTRFKPSEILSVKISKAGTLKTSRHLIKLPKMETAAL